MLNFAENIYIPVSKTQHIFKDVEKATKAINLIHVQDKDVGIDRIKHVAGLIPKSICLKPHKGAGLAKFILF